MTRTSPAIVAAVALSLLACRGSAQEPKKEEAPPVSDSDCNILGDPATPLHQTLAAATDGAIVCLPPGTYAGSHLISRSVTLRATGEGVVLDAGGEGPVLAVQDDGLLVVLEGLTLTGGSWEAGGGLTLEGRSEVRLLGCTVRGNRTGDYGGGALFARRGKVVVRDSVLESNQGKWGGAILADTVSRWEIEGTTIRGNTGTRGGGIAIRDGAQVAISGGSIEGNTATDADGAAIFVAGTTTRGPTLAITGTTIDAGVHDAMGNATIARD